jgi:hypothetical protein
MSLNNHIEEFWISIGGYSGPSYSVEIQGENLLYKIYGSSYILEKTESMKPSPMQLDKFWEDCDEINIWQWKTRYEDPDIIDGYSWKVDIKRGGKSIHSSGSNKTPAQFHKFLESVRELLGDVKFA